MKTQLFSWRALAVIAFAGAIFGSVGCSSSDSGSPTGSTGTDGGGTSATPTFTEVYAIFTRAPGDCPICHSTGTGAQGGLDLSSQSVAYTNLVGAAAGSTNGAMCASSGEKRVVAGNSAASLLYVKVANTQTCGQSMPFGGTMLAAADIATIKAWIDGNAPNN